MYSGPIRLDSLQNLEIAMQEKKKPAWQFSFHCDHISQHLSFGTCPLASINRQYHSFKRSIPDIFYRSNGSSFAERSSTCRYRRRYNCETLYCGQRRILIHYLTIKETVCFCYSICIDKFMRHKFAKCCEFADSRWTSF